MRGWISGLCGVWLVTAAPVQADDSIERLRVLADNGQVGAQYQLGVDYAAGFGVSRDASKAFHYYLLAATQGHVGAELQVAQDYELGQGVGKDAQQAIVWYQKAAEGGNSSAEDSLGRMYMTGRDVPADRVKARFWYEKAAAHGMNSAMLELGQLDWLDGRYDSALAWYRKGAEAGNMMCPFMLAEAYAKGDHVPTDKAEAFKWYKVAAMLGMPQAEYQVGRMYYNGEGVANDDIAAYMWLSIAADAGVTDAREDYNTVKPQITSEQMKLMLARKSQTLDAISRAQVKQGIVWVGAGEPAKN